MGVNRERITHWSQHVPLIGSAGLPSSFIVPLMSSSDGENREIQLSIGRDGKDQERSPVVPLLCSSLPTAVPGFEVSGATSP